MICVVANFIANTVCASGMAESVKSSSDKALMALTVHALPANTYGQSLGEYKDIVVENGAEGPISAGYTVGVATTHEEIILIPINGTIIPAHGTKTLGALCGTKYTKANDSKLRFDIQAPCSWTRIIPAGTKTIKMMLGKMFIPDGKYGEAPKSTGKIEHRVVALFDNEDASKVVVMPDGSTKSLSEVMATVACSGSK